MKKVKILIDKGHTLWAKENDSTYSNNPQDLLNYLGIDYKLENKDRNHDLYGIEKESKK